MTDLPPIEKSRSLNMKFAYLTGRRSFGKVSTSAGVFAARMPISIDSFYGYASKLEKKREPSPQSAESTPASCA
jgi:hypothetical protein